MRKNISMTVLAVVIVLISIVLIVGRGVAPRYPLHLSTSFRSYPFTLLTKDDLIKDIDSYITMIDSVHGDPYRVISKLDFIEKAEELKTKIQSLKEEKIQVIDCYCFLQELAASLQDEHTYIDFNVNWIRFLKRLFPFMIKIIDEKVYLGDKLGEVDIPNYSEIISINGIPIDLIIFEATKLLNPTLSHYKREILPRYFGLWLQAYFKMESPWIIQYRHAGKEEYVKVNGLGLKQFYRVASKKSVYTESFFGVKDEMVPVLEIPSFFYINKLSYNKFMDDFFKKHRDKKYLVISVRNNPGGEGSWGYFVLDYLTNSPYVIHKRFAHKISEPYKRVIHFNIHSLYHQKKIPRLLWWLPFYKYTGYKIKAERILKSDSGTYYESVNAVHNPDKNKTKFKGKVFLLTSHFTNSAAVVFAAAFKENDMGIVVGRETGGRMTFSSDPINVELPNSRLRASIPVAVLALPGDNPDRGVIPDINVEYTVEDFIRKKDKDLEAVKELIKKDLK